MERFIRSLMVVALTVAVIAVSAQTTRWNGIHKVKKNETIFGIAKEYDVGAQDIIEANPEMKVPGYQLKKGDLILVPYAKKGDKEVHIQPEAMSAPGNTPSSVSAKMDKAKNGIVHVGVMLPLHNDDGDGKRMVEYYRGILLALNQLKSEEINTEISAWNVPIDSDIRTILLKDGVDRLDIIFGPLYSNMVKPLAEYCRIKGIKLVIPFSITGDDVAGNPGIFQVYQTPEELNDKAVAAFLERFPNHHPIFIDCNDAASGKGVFTSELRRQLDAADVKYNLTNLDTPQDAFAKAFSSKQPNVIVVNSASSPQLNRTFAKLDSLKITHPGLAISMFGYTEWLMYQRYDLSQFFKYSVYIPTTFYYNAASKGTEALERLYEDSFGEKMMQDALPRFAITGYDQAMFFIRGFCCHGEQFTGSASQSGYKPLQTRYDFRRVGSAGGYKNRMFQLIHFLPNQTMEAITY